MQLGLKCIDQEDFSDQAAIDFSKSAQYYIQAAETYPEDDEHRPYFLAVALEALWWGDAPLRVTLPLCRKIRTAMPKPVHIWEFSQNSMKKRNANCEEAVRFLTECEQKLVKGEATLENALMPSDLVNFPFREIGIH